MTAGQQFGKLLLRLHVAQARRVRRGDVHGQVGGQRREAAHADLVVADAVGAVLVGADVDADDAGAAATLAQARFGRVVAFVVEAEPVDHRRVVAQAERCAASDCPDCGSGVTVPTSAKPKPSPSSASGTSAFLSKPAAMPSGLGKSIPQTFTERRWAFGTRTPTGRPHLQRGDREAVRGLRVEREQKLLADPVEHAHSSLHPASPIDGNSCSPSPPSGSARTHSTASRPSGP